MGILRGTSIVRADVREFAQIVAVGLSQLGVIFKEFLFLFLELFIESFVNNGIREIFSAIIINQVKFGECAAVINLNQVNYWTSYSFFGITNAISICAIIYARIMVHLVYETDSTSS